MRKARPPLPPGPYLVAGLARSGVAAALALRRADPSCRIVACDSGRPAEVEAAAGRLDEAGVETHLGSDGIGLLAGVDAPRTVIKSPGVPSEAGVVKAARERGISVVGELELAWRLIENRFIAVTGTNGKTTTTELIGAIFKEAGRPHAVAGNIGVAASSLAGELASDATVICEASSFQLEDCSHFAPEVAVFLNFSEDHLDRHGCVQAYLGAKLRIFANQQDGDLAICNAASSELLKGRAGQAEKVWFGLERSCREIAGCAATVKDGDLLWRGEHLMPIADIAMPGSHSIENCLAAASISLSEGIAGDRVASALRGFAGVAHRLELVGEVDGVSYVNDSKATNVASTAVALEAFDAPVHLIVGGSLKGGGFRQLSGPVAERCKACYLIGEAASTIARELSGSDAKLRMCTDLEGAVAMAAKDASAGEVVLLSPACASFDQFESYEQRGDHFRDLVHALGGEA